MKSQQSYRPSLSAAGTQLASLRVDVLALLMQWTA